MAVKLLVSQIGQHIIADVKQVENKETKEIIAYWVKNPRVVGYQIDDETQNIGVSFGPYCIVSDEAEFSIRANYIVSILEPRSDVVERYEKIIEEGDVPQPIDGEEPTDEPVITDFEEEIPDDASPVSVEAEPVLSK